MPAMSARMKKSSSIAQVPGAPASSPAGSASCSWGHEDDDIVAASRRELDVVGDDQDAAAEGAANLPDQLVEDVRSAHVDALGRLVENQQVGPLDQRPRQQQPLELAAGERRDGRIAEPLKADRVERGLDLPAGRSAASTSSGGRSVSGSVGLMARRWGT